MQVVPSYMRNTSASSGRVKRSSSTDRRLSIHQTEKSSHPINTKVARKKKPALTVPTAPSFTNRDSNSRKKILLSTEERQLQESARQREQLCRRRKKNAKMWTLASTSDGTLGVPAGTLGQVLKPRTVTEAVSPNFQSHPVKKISTETTEERELRKIAEEREQLALRKKQMHRRRSQAHQQNNRPVRVMTTKKPVTKANSPFLHTKVKNGPKVRGENKRGKRNSSPTYMIVLASQSFTQTYCTNDPEICPKCAKSSQCKNCKAQAGINKWRRNICACCRDGQ